MELCPGGCGELVLDCACIEDRPEWSWEEVRREALADLDAADTAQAQAEGR